MPTPIASDQPTIEILDLLSSTPTLWSDAVETVRTEALGIVRRITPPGGVHLRRRSSLSTYDYLRAAYEAVRDKVKFELASNLAISSYEWLWYLRRLPRAIFQGELRTTYGYDSILAEVLAGWAPRVARSAPISQEDGTLAFPVNRSRLGDVLWLCAWTLLLSEAHAAIRWSSKGVEFAFSDDQPFPEAIPSPSQRRAVRLYDTRMEKEPMSFFGSMTATQTLDRHTKDARSAVKSDKPFLFAVAPIKDRMVHVPIAGVPRRQWPRTLAGYAPLGLSTERLVDLAQATDLRLLNWPARVPTLLQLLVMSPLLFAMKPHWFANVLQRGYFVARWAAMNELMDTGVFAGSLSDLANELPTLDFATSQTQFWERLETIAGTDLPLAAGPVVRSSGDGFVAIDLWAATTRLNHDLQIRESGGQSINVRSSKFEDAVQDAINETRWRPTASTLALRKRLRRGKKDFTDIDAVGERNRDLLVVSCKFLAYSPEYDAGMYSVVRNTASTVLQGVHSLDHLILHPVGDNYDLSQFRTIYSVVCTPRPVYVPAGPATATVLGELRRSCSLDELGRELASRPGRHPRSRKQRRKRRP
jgi:hypothetical protein